MADFDDDNAVEMGGGGNAQPPRRRIAADFDDEDEAPAGEGEQQPQTQSRPPMKSWGDSSSASAQPQQGNAVAVESGNISSNIDDTGAGGSADAPKQGFGRRAAGGRANNAAKDKYDTDTITDITEIPDVEEEPREADLTSVVADAPNVRSNRVQALQELDQQILFQLPSAMGDGIDLSLLTSSLSPQAHVAEADALWEFDQLFADVSSEMQAEMEPDEKEEGEEEEGDDENAGVAKGDGKKAAAPIRDRSNRPVAAAASAAASAASGNTQVSSTEQQL